MNRGSISVRKIAYRVALTPRQLDFMLDAASKSGAWRWGNAARTAKVLLERGLVEAQSNTCFVTSTGDQVVRRAEQLALRAVLRW